MKYKDKELEEQYKEFEMLKLYEYRKSLYKKPVLRHLFLELTSRCNARCEHCGSRCDGNEQGEEVSSELIKKTLKEVAEHYDPGTVMLNVTGGEPLMRKDFFELMKYAKSLGFPWGITTNGSLITANVVEKLIDAGMSSVSVSIDGLEKTHESFRKLPGAYKKIMNGIKMMIDSKKIQIVQVTTVANKKNLAELEPLYKELCDIGLEYWRVVNCDPIGRAQDNDGILLDKEDFKYLFNFIQEKQKDGKMKEVSYGCSHFVGPDLEMKVRSNYFFCMTGLYVGSVLSNGDIFVCPNVPRRPELIQGNIKKDSFVDVWENKFKEFRSEDRTSNSECKKCKHWRYCMGDAFHTWNFDENKPNICLKDIFE